MIDGLGFYWQSRAYLVFISMGGDGLMYTFDIICMTISSNANIIISITHDLLN